MGHAHGLGWLASQIVGPVEIELSSSAARA